MKRGRKIFSCEKAEKLCKFDKKQQFSQTNFFYSNNFTSRIIF